MCCSPIKRWILAVRPKTLAASIVPVAVGSALAWRHGCFQPICAFLCLAFAVLSQVAANFANDWADGIRGTDKSEERLGPVRMVASGEISPQAMFRATLLILSAACCFGLGLLFYGGWGLIGVGAACALFAVLYSAGPFPLAYYGLGDVLVFVFFGLVATGMTYYLQTGIWTSEILWAACGVGLATNNILTANNYRDRDGDRQSGKWTLIALFGENFGRYFYLISGLAAAAAFTVLCWPTRPYSLGLPLVWLIFHGRAWRRLSQIREGKGLIKVLEMSSLNLLLFGIFFILWSLLIH